MVTESEIVLPNGAGSERVLQDTITMRLMEVVASVNSQGKLIDQDPLAGYIRVTYSDYTIAPFYDGFMKPDGSWYIRKTDAIIGAANESYCKGSAGGFTEAWANLSGQVYGDATIFA